MTADVRRTTESAAAVNMISNYVGGKWVAASGSESLPVSNPATGELLGRVPMATEADVGAAVDAASRAFPDWRETPAIDRARVLFRLKGLLEDSFEDLAVSLAREHGKVLPECRGEIRRGIENVEHACGIPTLMMGATVEDVASGIDCETVLQPLGVFGVITPYNFPVMIPLWFWPYAVATGNTVVLKPSEQDPLTHELVVDLAAKAGLPAGVLNVVHGTSEAVTALIEHPDVQGISFVGSSRIAQVVYREAANRGKRVQALGGAKNHLVVLPDADFDQASEAILASVFGSTGQRCLAGSVIVGVGEAYGEIKHRILDGAQSIRLGYALDEGTDMGPVISHKHRERVRKYIDQGVAEGADLLIDGRPETVVAHPEGHWIGPTVFDSVGSDMVIGKEEIFGPVCGLTRAGSLESAIQLIHRNCYGNMASVFTTSGRAAREFRYRVGISMLGINIGVAAPMAFFPFGGARGSFYGDLKAQGRDAVEFYTDKRVVISRW
jgi:malonate-semialdehyde dehydrogenase (acetylating)/methylmalonate-semialdehyde dehydrogenase